MGGVVTCPEYLAAFAGGEVLSRGGNAADAAIATAFAQGIVGPKLSGIGGIGVATVFDARRQASECIRFWGTAGSKAREDQFAGEFRTDHDGIIVGVHDYRNVIGYLSILVPGFVRGMYEVFVRYGSGRIQWADLVDPAIRLAEEGFEVDSYLYHFWRPETPVDDICPPYRTLTATPACAAIYTKEGHVLQPGDRLVQRDYAVTLQRIARDGPDEFYLGNTGRRISEDMERYGGLITADDLRRYRALESEPMRGSYRGYEVLSDPPPGSGALVIEILNILEGFDLVAMGRNSPIYLDLLARVFRQAFGDRRRFMADPRFVNVPVGMLTSSSYAEEVRGELYASSASGPYAPSGGHEGTTHVSVVDSDGNAAAITHSVCDASGVVSDGLGFMYNNDMSSFDPRPGQRNSIAAGKSPVNGGAPTILTKDGQAVLTIGSPAGPRKVTAIVQTILNIIDFGMSADQAVDEERIHQEVGPLLVQPTFPGDLARQLRGLGHDVRFTEYTARVAAVYRDPRTHALIGASDRRGGKGFAVVE